MSDFHEVRISPKISYGATGGPRRKTEIVELYSGFEERNTPWSQSRRSYNISFGIRDTDDVCEVMSFFEAREAALYGFRYKDWSDYKSTKPLKENVIAATDQQIGVGNNSLTEFQLIKLYSDSANTTIRDITKPVAGTVVIALDGVPQSSGWFVDTTTGIVTFSSAPGTGVIITAGYEFDVPVRFVNDEIRVNLANFEKGEIPDIALMEVRVSAPELFTLGEWLSKFNTPLDAYLFVGGNADDFVAGKISFTDGAFFSDGSGFAVPDMLPVYTSGSHDIGASTLNITGSVYSYIPIGGSVKLQNHIYEVIAKPLSNTLTVSPPLITSPPENTILDVTIASNTA